MEWCARRRPGGRAKAAVLGEISPELFGWAAAGATRWPTCGRVEQDGEVLGYGRLDDTCGDAECAAGHAGRRASGIGASS